MLPDMNRTLPCCLLLAALAIPANSVGQTVTLNQGGRDMRIAIGDAAVLPADFPPDIALPQPHAIARVQRSEARILLEIEAPGPLDDAAGRFDADMQAAGWVAAAMRQPPSGIAKAWEKDARAVLAWWTPTADGVHLQLELRPRH